MTRTGGELLVQCLEAANIDRIFSIPGESYLAVLDALHQSPIQNIVTRHESGAAMMAEADGKMTGRPGIAFVTRGPGATNAAAGVHIARQDSTPMILFVGQVARDMRGRDAFQEVDYRQTFRDLAKWVDEIDDADRIPEILARAFHTATSGRPGPVVLALPEDMLRDLTRVEPINPAISHTKPAALDLATVAAVELALTDAKAPIMILGGSSWSASDSEAAQRFAERNDLPVACTFRRQHLFPSTHPCYAGDIGIGPNPKLKARIEEADLVLMVGTRMSEISAQGYALFDIPKPKQKLIHVLPDSDELGRVYQPDLSCPVKPGAFFRSFGDRPEISEGRAKAAHQDYLAWTKIPDRESDGVSMERVIAALQTHAPDDVILTNGAGNYSGWMHRYWRFAGVESYLGPTSGSMGYGLPAAIAAKLRYPWRPVVCFAGDGCFQMTSQELGTAAQWGVPVIVLVIDNGSYGTIRMHQERDFPGRVSGTVIVNPDFAAIARAYGGIGETVTTNAEVEPAIERALGADRLTVLHIKTDLDAITPATTIGALRDAKS